MRLYECMPFIFEKTIQSYSSIVSCLGCVGSCWS